MQQRTNAPASQRIAVPTHFPADKRAWAGVQVVGQIRP